VTRPPRTDVLLAGALALGSAVEAAALDGFSGTAVALVLVCAPVAWRRVVPGAAVLAGACVIAAVTTAAAGVENSIPLAAFVLCVFTFATRADRRTLWLVLPPVVVLTESAVVIAANEPVVANMLFTAIAFLGLPLLAGRLVRTRTALTGRLAEQARELEAEREQHAARAVEDERTRIAADLHALLATGVRAMIDEVAEAERCAATDPPRCDAAIAAVEDRGRATLVEMRRLLGVLRRGDEDLALAPQPSLARLDALAAHLGRAGREARITVEGEPHALTPGVDIAAYRIVEEALAAAADAPAQVLVRWERDRFELEVRSAGPALDRDAALARPRERVELFGGHARNGRLPGGGSVFAAHLPTREREVVA
jgi:signal transduction histidine kinase